MKFGILADIHSNLEALNCCIEGLKGIDNFICPGDIVGYGPNPNECIDIIKGLKCSIVAGNHERACCGIMDPTSFTGEAGESIRWTVKILTAKNREYIELLPDQLDLHGFQVVHGSLRNPLEEYISNIQTGAISIELMKQKVLFVGHLHIPLVIVKDTSGKYDSWQLADGDVVNIDKFDKVIINAGAVGQPRDMDPRASFGIYDSEAQTVKIKRVEYNIKAVQDKMRKAELPDFLAERLKYGR